MMNKKGIKRDILVIVSVLVLSSCSGMLIERTCDGCLESCLMILNKDYYEVLVRGIGIKVEIARGHHIWWQRFCRTLSVFVEH